MLAAMEENGLRAVFAVSALKNGALSYWKTSFGC